MNDDLFTRLKDDIRTDWQALSKWREEAFEAYAYVAGDQWSAEDRADLKEAAREAITFNRIETVIESVSGSEINNRREVRYIPREAGDAGVNEILTGAAEWFRDEAEAEEEDSDAFRDALISGVGWTETILDFDEDPEGAPKIERIDPLDMGWDSTSTRRNLRDARRVFRVHKLKLPEAREQFPGVNAH